MITILETILGVFIILIAIWSYVLILKSLKEGEWYEEADDERH